MISLKAYSQDILTMCHSLSFLHPLTGLRNPKAMLLRNFGVMKWAMGFHKESLELFEEVPMGNMQLDHYQLAEHMLIDLKMATLWGKTGD